MTRGTTPSLIFSLEGQNVDLNKCSQIEVYLRQEELLIQKNLPDLQIRENNIIVATLTQEETLSLSAFDEFGRPAKCEVQVRLGTEDGHVDATEIVELSVNEILKESEIGGDKA